jgi:hypothetical protein
MLTAWSLILATIVLAAPREGIVAVSAMVRDEKTGKEVSRIGTGTLLKKGDRYFVLTAAHVAMGAEIKLDSGEKLQAIARQTNAADDLEWIEVSPPKKTKALAEWKETCSCFFAEESISEGMDFIGNDRFVPKVPWANTGWRLDFFDTRREFLYPGKDNQRSKELGTAREVLPVRIAGGLSGAPLFQREENGFRLNGVAQSFDRRFAVSYFAGESSIQRLFEKKQTGKARWRLRDGVSFLDFGNGLEELVPMDTPAGKSDTDDGGKSDTDDGGKSDTDDGSKSGSVGKKANPGILFQGRTILAARISEGEEDISDFVYVDRVAVDLLDRNAARDALPVGAELQGLLTRRLGGAKKGEKFYSDGTGIDKQFPARLEVLEEGISLELPISGAGEPGAIDVIILKLDKFGKPIGAKQFEPVIQVKSKRGKIYFVDLRSFYFRHLSWENIRKSQSDFPIVRVRSADAKSEVHYGFYKSSLNTPYPELSSCSESQLSIIEAHDKAWIEELMRRL